MGTEIVIGDDDEPSFEVDDDLETVIEEIGGWGFLCRGGEVTYTGYLVPVSGLSSFAESAEALAEQYGDEARAWSYEREIVHADGRTETRSWSITGLQLRGLMLDLAATARGAARRQQGIVLNMDD